MSNSVSQKRCFHHPGREAVALCVACKDYFCSECVIEHDHRMMCNQCIQQIETTEKRGSSWLAQGIQLVIVVMFLWFSTFLLGRLIHSIPQGFHEHTVFQSVEAVKGK